MKAFTTLAAALLLAAPALADGSTLTATTTGDLASGTTITLDLAGSFANAPTFLAVGQTLGTTTIKLPGGDLVLGLDSPFAILAIGATDGAGALSKSFSTKPIPVSIDPITLNVQAASLKIQIGGGPPKIAGCASNVASVTLQ